MDFLVVTGHTLTGFCKYYWINCDEEKTLSSKSWKYSSIDFHKIKKTNKNSVKRRHTIKKAAIATHTAWQNMKWNFFLELFERRLFSLFILNLNYIIRWSTVIAEVTYSKIQFVPYSSWIFNDALLLRLRTPMKVEFFLNNLTEYGYRLRVTIFRRDWVHECVKLSHSNEFDVWV